MLPLGLCDPVRAAPTPIVAISSDRAGRGPSLYLPADTNTPQRHKKGKYPESLPMDCPLPLLAISSQRWVEFYPVLLCYSASTLGLSRGIVSTQFFLCLCPELRCVVVNCDSAMCKCRAYALLSTLSVLV